MGGGGGGGAQSKEEGMPKVIHHPSPPHLCGSYPRGIPIEIIAKSAGIFTADFSGEH